ncbi:MULTISPECIES: ABC transporter ATP-binding protein [unclassified Saccharibacter]|uniref:ABC transporter ATP-binding protein n=1 Tax=unclassified Saccharibacter TaxID=2648722 RepID=UPI001326760A|nr:MULTISPECIES: ABC transporter ATP-binding protein [unclassified Saccharibacter]MXV35322.1 ABC transporter ATP-binding protein [Saccharibacter sp. EH611]MXV57830.1 ABC transporter ATP-binding protein [Saccharibacter sp. EH70]MXV65256.1 ABC transporter ATP-binding protein [Saccharibacter sp. EH60]
MSETMTTVSYSAALELMEARPMLGDSGLASAKYNFLLGPGECALIECRDAVQRTQFVDVCTGVLPAGEGTVKCMGLDWKALEERQIWALRGRIGRVFSSGNWIDLYGTHMNVMWPRLHHSSTDLDVLVEEAVKLGIRFGLPGLPIQPPGRLSALDRRRAEYIRAFLGKPSLLLLEDPVSLQPEGLYEAFLSELTAAMQRGCAVVWIASDHAVWHDYVKENMQVFRLGDSGLMEMRSA